MPKKRVLSDLGERAIIRDILSQYTDPRDDCAFVEAETVTLAITTDPVPVPAAKLLGGDPDLYWVGRLLVTINASDLAASGASPVGFVAAIDAPPDLELTSFERLLRGIYDACTSERLKYLGGNLRENPNLTAVGTAIGSIRGRPLKRSGARIGDALMCVGPSGVFWRDALTLLRGGEIANKESSPVFCPHSQMKVMAALASENIVHASMDNSDGLLPTLETLSILNEVEIELDLEKLAPPPGEYTLDIDPALLWLGWGDWNVVIAVSMDDAERVLSIAKSNESTATHIGFIKSNAQAVTIRRGLAVMRAPRLESERFAKDSWFTEGIHGYIDRLLSLPIPSRLL